MMNLSDVESRFHVVERSLKACPRNAYEAQNRYQTNMELLSKARDALKEYSGARIEELNKRLVELEEAVIKAKHKSAQSITAQAAASAFCLDDFVGDAGNLEGELEKEMLKAAELLKPSGKKKERKPKDKKVTHAGEKQLSKEMGSQVWASAVQTSSIVEELKISVPVATAVSSYRELVRFNNCRSDAIPLEAMSEGKSEPLPDSALAAITLEKEIEYDGHTCRCRIELYRCVLLALAMGEAISTLLPTSITVNAQEIAPPSKSAEEQHTESAFQRVDEMASPEGSEDSRNKDNDNDDDGSIQYLSSKLIAKYELVQEENERLEAAVSFPKEVSPLMVTQLRRFSYLTWVIVMCHGGFFAGGIFVDGECVLHKSFQRYVVRKKQGGKQSTNSKDGGGSYNSVGSQIRAEQEVKWKLEVRDILLAWRSFIDNAQFILYAAPSPQNRMVLTDFFLLPPSPTGGKAEISPIHMKDPRVRRVPITTHRPSFEEVKRIYEVVSQCSVVYVTLD